jgi:hypothetical protein
LAKDFAPQSDQGFGTHKKRDHLKQSVDRLPALDRFYDVLRALRERLGGTRLLKNCSERLNWPKQGMYFFFEPGELRSTGEEPRVVRVGTHAVSEGSATTLWTRLRTHRGSLAGPHAGGGNHRGSIFRLHVGTALLTKENLRNEYPSWGKGSSAPKPVRDHEYPMERRVSTHICNMPFLWLKVEDQPSPNSMRAYLERNAIALLGNCRMLRTQQAIDPPSAAWLGRYCENVFVRESGLWNVNHVDGEAWDAAFLDELERLIEKS